LAQRDLRKNPSHIKSPRPPNREEREAQRDATSTVLAIVNNHQIVVLHSFKNLGGIIFNPMNKFACLIGTGRVALAIIFDKASLLAICDIATQGYKTIIACLDKAEIEGLAHPPKAPKNFQCVASFLLAPLAP
jgi:hypothetical protein